MDPNKALANLIDAVRSQDREAYSEALQALAGWDRGGAFMPTVLPPEPESAQ